MLILISFVIIDHAADQVIHEEGDRRIVRYEMSVVFYFAALRWVHS